MPFVSSILPVFARAIVSKLVGALFARPAAAAIVDGKIKLFSAGPFPITPNSVAADFTECTFGGYGEVTPIVPTTINLPSTQGLGANFQGNWVATGSDPQNVAGYYIVDTDDNFVAGETFPAPIPMLNNGDFIDLSVVLPVAFEVTVQD